MSTFGTASIVKTFGGITFPYPQITSEAVTSIFAYSGELDLGDPVHEKYVDYVILDVTAEGDLSGVTVEIGYHDRVKDTVVWVGPFDLGTMANEPMFMRATSRFWKLNIEDTIGAISWMLSAAEFYGQVMEGQP